MVLSTAGKAVVSLRAPGSYLDHNYSSGLLPAGKDRRLSRRIGTAKTSAVVSGAVALGLRQCPTVTAGAWSAVTLTDLTWSCATWTGTSWAARTWSRATWTGSTRTGVATTVAQRSEWPHPTGNVNVWLKHRV